MSTCIAGSSIYEYIYTIYTPLNSLRVAGISQVEKYPPLKLNLRSSHINQLRQNVHLTNRTLTKNNENVGLSYFFHSQ